jgi:SSS family solute:Na+ symporter
LNLADYLVLLGTLLGIAAYGAWRTRRRKNLGQYLRGDGTLRWAGVGLSVMATQASAITFLSTPGQGYQDGLGFVQNYFGLPLALILIAAVFVPIYKKLDVTTAYEFLAKRFDERTRLLGAGLFLISRGLAAGITIYAPAIVLSAIFGWRLDLTILGSGLVAIAYTAIGGTEAVSLTQKYQMGVIFAGMVAAFAVLLVRLGHHAGLGSSLLVAGTLGKLHAVDFSTDLHRRYTFWNGCFAAFFLMLSYFGTDQSQVQRYLAGASVRESRFGLMFNAVLKIPMQFFILLLGVLVFVFYQYEPSPMIFNHAAWERAVHGPAGPSLREAEADFQAAHEKETAAIGSWLGNRGVYASEVTFWHDRAEAARNRAVAILRAVEPNNANNDADYVFITFVVDQLPHGLIGLLVAVFFAATLSSKAAELNALGTTTTVDFYRSLRRRPSTDRHDLAVSRIFTVLWGFAALAFALLAHLAENLIQAVNILGSLFYGVILGLFLIAFFLRRVRARAAFWSGVVSEVLVLAAYGYNWRQASLHGGQTIAYLWFNLLGCAACVILSLIFEAIP